MSNVNGLLLEPSADDEYDAVRDAMYEYKLSQWISFMKERKKKGQFDEKVTFHLSLLPMESSWKIEQVSETEYSVKRKLEFLPMEPIANWSVTISISDRIIGHNRAFGKEKRKCRGPLKELANLTATNEKPFVEFEYIVKESKRKPLFSEESFDYFSNISITVVECKNLSRYLKKCVDFRRPFSMSNVILEMDDGKRIFYVFEALALQSTIFYNFFVDRDSLPKEGNCYVIKMEDTDIVAIIIILKLLTYKENKAIDEDNVERVVVTSKKWKFEMILALCEEFLTEDVSDFMKLSYLAVQYDMTKLQQRLWERQHSTLEQVQNLQNSIIGETGAWIRYESQPVRRYLNNITAEKFEFPEMVTSFSHKGLLKFKPGVQAVHFLQEWILDWQIRWSYNNHGSLFFTIGPSFPEGVYPFSALNWSVNFVVTVKINGKERKFPTLCTPNRKSCSYIIESKLKNIENTRYEYSLTVDVKCIKGLRIYIYEEKLRTFETRSLSSDVVLKCGDKKLFANTKILALHSDFFKAMIDHPEMQAIDPEEQLPTVTIDNADTRTLTMILEYAYNIVRRPLKPLFAMDVIPVADYYMCSRLLHHCERILIDSQYYPLGIKTIDFATDYNLPILKDEYIRQFVSVYDIQMLKSDPNYNDASPEAKAILFETMMDLPLVDPR